MTIASGSNVRHPTKASRRPYAILRCTLGFVLLVAAVMKGWELGTGATLGQTLPLGRYVGIAQVEFEAILGLWLLSGLRPRVSWLISLICFAGFAVISFRQALRGETSCGCFGRLTINPWLTASIDSIAAVALLLFRRQANQTGPTHLRRLPMAGTAGVIAVICIPSALWMLHPQLATLDTSGELPAGDAMVYLQPEDWLGKPFPLLKHTNIGPQLAQGRWVVVIYSSSCSHCRPAVPEYEQLAIDLQDKPDAPRIALVEVPPCAPPERNKASGLTPAVLGQLTPQRKWFIVTPVILALEDGIVLTLAGNAPAGKWVAAVFSNDHDTAERPAGK